MLFIHVSNNFENKLEISKVKFEILMVECFDRPIDILHLFQQSIFRTQDTSLYFEDKW